MDEVLLGKAEIIERCLQRIETEYRGSESELETNFTKQDSILLNIQRMCEASIDAAMHMVRLHALGIPKDSRQAFTMLVNANLLDPQLGKHLEAMVGFRNIAVHNYTEINMDIVRSILNERLVDIQTFARFLIKQSLPKE
ncbi:MAG: type VII toxin-antitoxin system HepT family RNase toxin [Gammaproteobacteria bacterium]